MRGVGGNGVALRVLFAPAAAAAAISTVIASRFALVVVDVVGVIAMTIAGRVTI